MNDSKRWIDREAVLALAKKNSEEKLSAAQRGEDVYALSERHSQEIHDIHTAGMTDSEKVEFLNIYSEAVESHTEEMLKESRRLEGVIADAEQKHTKDVKAGETLGKVIAFVVIAGFVWLILQKL
ncbi:hypothetical protein [Salinicola sp. CR57]|uniref:hypothetical protein n=1 Tax=Salinicola sp. CR57 TaxID=1949086 RepID=UPI000DA1C6EC|nr:hypothetical protein [Salinicola sp. CR57]